MVMAISSKCKGYFTLAGHGIIIKEKKKDQQNQKLASCPYRVREHSAISGVPAPSAEGIPQGIPTASAHMLL